MRPHGYARYRLDGCRCYVCAYARSEYDSNRDRLIAYGRWQPFVPIAETQMRILSLRDIGLGDRSIALLAQLNRKVVRDIRTGVRHDPGRGNPPLSKIRAETAAAIAAIAHDPLGAQPGATCDATMTWERVHALIRAGYTRGWIARQLGARRPALQLGRDRVTVANARAVALLVERVGMRPGPSARASAEGERLGWPLLEDLFTERPRANNGPRTPRLVVSATDILAEIGDEDARLEGAS